MPNLYSIRWDSQDTFVEAEDYSQALAIWKAWMRFGDDPDDIQPDWDEQPEQIVLVAEEKVLRIEDAQRVSKDYYEIVQSQARRAVRDAKA